MIRFSFSTVYTAVIASNILLIILTLCFRNKKLMINTGYKLLSIFGIFTLLRFLLPFELPFTQSILFPEWISAVVAKVRRVWCTVGGIDISIWLFLVIIWIIGFLVKLVQYIRTNAKSRYYILANSLDATTEEPYRTMLQRICNEKHKKNRFQVWRVSGIKSPLLYGMLKPHILMPEGLELSEEDLYYVFAHETSHHFHHDLLTKTIIRFIDMIYWWNPFCHMLVKQTDTILEMRVDNVITLSDTHSITDYLTCLLQLTEHSYENCPISDAVTMPLLSFKEDEDETEMTRRFSMLASSSQKKKHSINIALLLSVVSIYIFSYAFIWEAHHASPEVEATTFAPDSDMMHAVLREDNTYDIYFNGKLIENTDSLEYHPGIKVYTEKEYYNETQ